MSYNVVIRMLRQTQEPDSGTAYLSSVILCRYAGIIRNVSYSWDITHVTTG